MKTEGVNDVCVETPIEESTEDWPGLRGMLRDEHGVWWCAYSWMRCEVAS